MKIGNREINNKVIYYSMGSVFSLGIMAYIATSLVPNALVSLTKAAPSSKVSLVNSNILPEKILVRADGKEACRVNVFVLDNSSKGVQGKRIDLQGKDLDKAYSQVSNAEGKGHFELVSKEEKQIKIEALVGGSLLTGKSVICTFRNSDF